MQTEMTSKHEHDTDRLLSKNKQKTCKNTGRWSTFQLIILCVLSICFAAFIANIDRIIDSTSSCNEESSSNDLNTYDYIIIGAGTAGSIIAAELSKNNSVLLIEEGGWSSQWDIVNDASRAFETLSEPQIERGYVSIAQQNLNNRTIPELRAKMTGGCGSHNILGYILGQKKDFDERWNIDGWRWNDLEPLWNYIDETFKHIVIDPNGEWPQRFVQVGVENGYTFTAEPNNLSILPSNATFIKEAMCEEVTVDYAQRTSTWTEYIEPILGVNENLNVIVYTRVNKILFETTEIPQAYGVETYGIGDKTINQFIARKEVILSAGTVDSPKILMLSGIGDCEYLESLNIVCIANVPAVGKNLENHLRNYIRSPPFNNQSMEFPKRLCTIYGTQYIKEAGTYHIGLDIETASNLEGVIGLFQLKSRGEILLFDNNPESNPIINGNYFSHSDDEQIWIEAFKETRKLLYSDSLMPFYNVTADEISPGFDVDTDQEILEWGRQTLDSYHHLSSSCKMGNEFNDDNLYEIVVNNKLQVRGVNNLRVIDQSIAPHGVSANTNQVTVLIGLKGVQILRD